MLNSVLSTDTELVSGGVATAASRPPAQRLASGWTATENGRSWFWITGVVSWNSGRAAVSAGPNAWANGSSSVQRRRARGRERLHLARASGWSARAFRVAASALPRGWRSCEEIAAKFVFDELISEVSGRRRRRAPWPRAEGCGSSGGCCWSAARASVVNVCVSRFSGANRLNVPGSAATPRLGAAPWAAVVEQLRAAAEQQQQVVARVGVERRQDLVDVDVRASCARARACRRPGRRRSAVPGSSARYMSFSGVRGRSSTVALR